MGRCCRSSEPACRLFETQQQVYAPKTSLLLPVRSVGLIKDFICPYKISPLPALDPACGFPGADTGGYFTLANAPTKLGAINPSPFLLSEMGDNKQDVKSRSAAAGAAHQCFQMETDEGSVTDSSRDTNSDPGGISRPVSLSSV